MWFKSHMQGVSVQAGRGMNPPRTALINVNERYQRLELNIKRQNTYVNASSWTRRFSKAKDQFTTMSAPPPTPEQLAAAAAAARQFNIEAFTLLGVGLLVTILRTYVRVASVGWKRLQVDDYLVWFAAVSSSLKGHWSTNMSNR